MVKLPWIFPGIRQPNFYLPKIEPTIPTSISPRVIYTLVYVSVFYIFIGGVYDLIQSPIAIGADSAGNPVLVYTNALERQFLIEGIVAGLLMFLGALGLFLLKEAPSNPHDTDRANMLVALGMASIFIAWLALENMIQQKL